jgi:hypothetical protein
MLFLWEQSGISVKLTFHFYPVLRLRMMEPPFFLNVFMIWCSISHRDIFAFVQ